MNNSKSLKQGREQCVGSISVSSSILSYLTQLLSTKDGLVKSCFHSYNFIVYYPMSLSCELSKSVRGNYLS